MMKKILSLVNNLFAKTGYKICSVHKGKPNPINPWEDEQRFVDLYSGISSNTLVDKKRCFMLYQFAQQALSINGEAAEIGVYKGGTAKLIAGIFKDKKKVHIFDTFSGMPETDPEKDLHKKGDFSDLSLAEVSEYLKLQQNIVFHDGWFPETASPVADVRFSFVHVDVDIYKSVHDCCDFFYERMNHGGVLIFDDYGFLSCPGAKEAVDEFFEGKPEHPIYLATGQCVVIKI